MKLLILLLFVVLDIASGRSVKDGLKGVTGGVKGRLEKVTGATADTANLKSEHTCEYDGKTYKEGDVLPTRHMCLACNCTKEFKEPNNFYCSVIDCPRTNHLDIGCEPVFDPNECCPTSWNCENTDQCKCEKRYFQHYEVKGCTPVYREGCDCPVKFECKPPDQFAQNENVCRYYGKTYQRGETIETGNPCEICSCLDDPDGSGLGMVCIGVECPSTFGLRPNDSCYDVFDEGTCCPIRTECPSDDQTQTQTQTKMCDFEGKMYHLGQSMYSEQDPCKTCICSDNWDIKPKCRTFHCNMERWRKHLLKGCVPIYHEGACCPIEMFCGTIEEGYKNITYPMAQKSEIESGNACFFKGSYYSKGQILEINHPTNCVTCTCLTPPDFTCVQKSCPRPPNDDYENCIPSYNPGECCPTYSCKGPFLLAPMSAPTPEPQCSPVQCPEGCSIVTVHNSCPFCQCHGEICAPPRCPFGCEVQKTLPPNSTCLGCDCGPHATVTPICDPVNCPSNCYQVKDPNGCPSCVCGPLCTPPECGPGCKVLRDVPEGECPRCSCHEGDPLDVTVQCSPVKCPPSCPEVTGPSGCPSCNCGKMCSPPKCDHDCTIEDNGPDGCPYCACKGRDPSMQPMCSPVKCGPLCHEAFDGSGCPSCICDPTCSPPRCEQGCQLEYNPSEGPCPKCVCKIKRAPVRCPEIKCGSMCRLGTGSDGCSTCLCGPTCTPPKCEAPCHLEHDRAAGPCPACVCSDNMLMFPGVECSPLKCEASCTIDHSTKPCPSCDCNNYKITGMFLQCSPPNCGAGCRLDYSTSCPTCVCDAYRPVNYNPLCAMPNCDPPCFINYNSRPCASCVCEEKPSRPAVQCSIPNCEPGCFVDYTASPCPSCKCGKMNLGIQCSVPKCEGNCYVDYTARPCPACFCPGEINVTAVQCLHPKCPRDCRLDYSTKPCPSCNCNEHGVYPGSLVCSMPKCDPPCRINYDSQPCPTCSCDRALDLTAPQCSPPKCPRDCRIDFTAKPCPACKCNEDIVSPDSIYCSMPKCDPPCRINYDSQPCPTCSCDRALDFTAPQCSPTKCPRDCRIDFTATPCPACKCNEDIVSPDSNYCSMPKCDPPCRINYDSQPCPTCSCDSQMSLQSVQCSPPKCDEPGCQMDYSTQPCPSCRCGAARLQCSPPVCSTGCTIDYNAKPCPACNCGMPEVGSLQCSMPKCSIGCEVDYTAKPCPACKCGMDPFGIQCSMPRCDPGCSVDYSTRPCPSCKCNLGMRLVQCVPPKCDPGCELDYSTKPCPSCKCGSELFGVQCSMPKCDVGCEIDYDTKPCPSCKCGPGIFGIQCSIPRCDPGCDVDYDTRPCPSCKCGIALAGIQCSPPKCDEPGCRIDYDTKPCPSCRCEPRVSECPPLQCKPPCFYSMIGEEGCPTCQCKPVCTPPVCESGCRVDYTARPCPSCICDRYLKSYAPMSMPSAFYPPQRDSYCARLRCGPGCQLEENAPENERCPRCICQGESGRQACMATECELPCRWERFSQYGCPSCICHPIPCPAVECRPGYAPTRQPGERCPRCEPVIGGVGGIQCTIPRCSDGCQVDYTATPCPACKCGTDEPIAPLKQAGVKG